MPPSTPSDACLPSKGYTHPVFLTSPPGDPGTPPGARGGRVYQGQVLLSRHWPLHHVGRVLVVGGGGVEKWGSDA